jgi:hypothetical protein
VQVYGGGRGRWRRRGRGDNGGVGAAQAVVKQARHASIIRLKPATNTPALFRPPA